MICFCTSLFGLLLFVSCSQPKQFHGFAGLDIGADFTSMPVASGFTKTMDDEFNIERFDLGQGIGEVRNLNVSVCEGKICEVRFQSTPKSNKMLIENVTKTMKELKLPEFAGPLKFFVGTDDRILFVMNDDYSAGLKKIKPSKSYFYQSSDHFKSQHNYKSKPLAAITSNRE
ncbi:MAG: hypothetical protein EOO01_39625 [Chitinophagaceae bacterium]|nr:MAG: hypothetical protein EOO01_39625 [Chitinophagaceae bacterium]